MSTVVDMHATPAGPPGQPSMRGRAREALLEAAIAAIQERGYASTTARDLTANSGADLRSIGYHFGSKERLMTLALIEAFARWTSTKLDPVEPSSIDELLERTRAFLSELPERKSLARGLVEAVAAARDEEVRGSLAAHHREVRARLSETLTDALHLDAQTAAAAAVAVLALSDGLMLLWLVDEDVLGAAVAGLDLLTQYLAA